MSTVPFSFTFTATGDIGALWNPHSVVTGIDLNNTLYSDYLAAVGGAEPPGRVVVTSICVMTDDGGDGAVSLGYWDTVANAFVQAYEITASAVAGGGFVRDMGEGVPIPCSPTKVACLRYDGTTGGLVTGDVRLWIDQEYADMTPPTGI